ncbi:MAG: hypothetical protein R3Y23_03495 [Bacillota bacterium]
MITAHGGALDTGRNSYKYFRTISNYKVEAIEVNVWKMWGKLCIAHNLPPIIPQKFISLEYVFGFCKTTNKMVNLDLKCKNIAKDIVALAKKMNVEQYIKFSGKLSAQDINNIDVGEIFVNTQFYPTLGTPSVSNLKAIKDYLDTFNNPCLKGINIPYRYASTELIEMANSIGLNLSVYICDEKLLLERLIPLDVYNITTNNVGVALALRESIKQ